MTFWDCVKTGVVEKLKYLGLGFLIAAVLATLFLFLIGGAILVGPAMQLLAAAFGVTVAINILQVLVVCAAVEALSSTPSRSYVIDATMYVAVPAATVTVLAVRMMAS